MRVYSCEIPSIPFKALYRIAAHVHADLYAGTRTRTYTYNNNALARDRLSLKFDPEHVSHGSIRTIIADCVRRDDVPVAPVARWQSGAVRTETH